jgi:hypothetical protein
MMLSAWRSSVTRTLCQVTMPSKMCSLVPPL